MTAIPATITAIEKRTSDISALYLMPSVPFAYDAGQYVEVTTNGLEKRPFSIASAPVRNGAFVLHVRDLGRGLSHYLCNDARIGDAVSLEGPMGHMHAQNTRGKPVFMIGGGTGVVPLLAIAEDIVRKGYTEDGMTLIYGVRTENDIHCAHELEILSASGELSIHMAIGSETPDRVIARLAPKLKDHIVYLSGPDPMLFNILPALRAHGLQDDLLFTDANLKVLSGVMP
ncbi:MAG TPA: FAD-binding oxidoreductase [Alphaproteobacteria bacterium]